MMGDLMQEGFNAGAARNAVVLIAVVVLGAAFWWLREILTPLALAFFLMVMIDGFARVLEHRARLPSKLAVPISVLILSIGFGLIALVVATNAAGFVGQLVNYGPKIDAVIAKIAAQVGAEVPPTAAELLGRFTNQYASTFAGAFKSLTEGAVFVLVYVGFLFASRQGFKHKADMLFDTDEEHDMATRVFSRIQTGIERYLWVQTITGLMIAGATWAIMAMIGLNNALFWAFIVFIASYIPILGGAVSILMPPLFALVQFDSYWPAVELLVGAEAVHIVVGNVIAPRMQGVTLNVDPVVVLLSLTFWGAMLGVPGMFMSTPLTVVAIVIMAQFPGTRWLAILLSHDGDPLRYSEGPTDPSEADDEDHPDPWVRRRRRRQKRHAAVKG